jgi:L-malate glycosyltransferase
MSRGNSSAARRGAVLLVGPEAPPSGGMAVQAQLLGQYLRGDGDAVLFFPSNFRFPGWLRATERIPGARTVLRAILIWPKLWSAADRAEVVHVLAASWLYFFTVVAPAVLVARMRGKRVVVNYRGGEAERFFERYGRLAAPILKLATLVTVPSGFLAGVLGKYFSGPVVIVPNLIDGSAFVFRERNTFLPRMLVTRQLEAIYDIETVLEAFACVREQFPEASLWIAGTGSQRAQLEDMAARLSLENVRFLGHVPHAELPAIYGQCDILLNASRVDNFPGSLLEASAAGLVVVSTCAGGIPYIYEHGKSAFLVEPGDWRAMARAVARVVQDPSEARQVAARALTCARNCEWAKVRAALHEAYGFPSAENPSEMDYAGRLGQ